MTISTNIYRDFQCTGSQCLATCCADWEISLSEKAVQYYQELSGEFGEFIRENLIEKEGEVQIKLTEDRRCPFLDEKNLCQIYQQCGEENMTRTCQVFPRNFFRLGDILVTMLTNSCEEVLRIIAHKEEGVVMFWFYGEEEAPLGFEDLLPAVGYLSWALPYLQSGEHPFGVALGVIASLPILNAEFFLEKDSRQMPDMIEMAGKMEEEFALTSKTISMEGMETLAWNLIFHVVDIFFTRISRNEKIRNGMQIWPEHVFSYSEEERKRYLLRSWEGYSMSASCKKFLMRIAASYLCSRAMQIETKEDVETTYLIRFCNFMILACVLPAVWKLEEERIFLSEMARLSRNIEHTQVLEDTLWSKVYNLLRPDVLTYAMAFMILLDKE